ncbi:MAG TPA: hypothetical protein VGH20_14555 [Myxococcales bacterium]|jgi:hypothetical protein
MKRIGIGIAALGLSLSALTFGAKAANAAEPCAPQVVTVQPSGYFYGYASRDFRARERLRIEHERELARRQALLRQRGYSYRYSR